MIAVEYVYLKLIFKLPLQAVISDHCAECGRDYKLPLHCSMEDFVLIVFAP